MDVIEKMRQLLKVGITKATIARYCHYHPNSLNYYLNKGATIQPEVAAQYEEGLRQMLEDIRKIIDT